MLNEKNIFKNLAIVTFFTISTNFAFSAQIDAGDLEPTGDVGKALAPLLARPEAADLKAVVENALATHTPLYSGRDIVGLIAAIGTYEAALQSIDDEGDDTIANNMLAMGGHRLADISSLFVSKSASEIEQEQIDARWDAFLHSQVGRRVAEKGDSELRFGRVTGFRSSELLANKPHTLADAEALIKEVTDYYDVNQAFPRVIQEVRSLRYHLATASISSSDVDTLFYNAGFYSIVRKLESMDGKGRIIEALEKIKAREGEHVNMLRDNVFLVEALLAENAHLKMIIVGSGSDSFAPPSPPPANQHLAAAKAKTPDLFSGDGLPLLTLTDLDELDSVERAALMAAFEKHSAFQATATDDK